MVPFGPREALNPLRDEIFDAQKERWDWATGVSTIIFVKDLKLFCFFIVVVVRAVDLWITRKTMKFYHDFQNPLGDDLWVSCVRLWTKILP